MNSVRGTADKPFRDLRELRSGIIGRTDCTLYTYGTFNIPEDVLEEIKERNIILEGMAVAFIEPALEPIYVSPEMLAEQMRKITLNSAFKIGIEVDNKSNSKRGMIR